MWFNLPKYDWMGLKFGTFEQFISKSDSNV